MSKKMYILDFQGTKKKRSKIPDSWNKVFGLLRGRTPDALKELKRMRTRDEARSKSLEKLWKR